MIPLRLNPRNFLCYTDVHQPLEFQGLSVACLTGDNGHGKSALLDAITWALWGKARAKRPDDLIHHGRTEMEVEFEFQLDDQRYRVIRKRQLKSRSDLSDLDLAVWTGAGWRSIRGNSIAETEKKIAQLLRMSYDTFVNSSFILQGKADLFTTAGPADRKRVLAEILDLAEYEALEAKAKEALRARESDRAVLADRVREADRQLAERQSLAARRDALTATLAELEARVAAADEDYQAKRQELARVQAAAERLTAARQRRVRLEREVEQQRAEIARQAERQRAVEQVIARADEIERSYDDLLAARAERDDWNERLRRKNELDERARPLQRAIQRAEVELSQRVGQLRERQARLEQQAAGRAAAEAELARATAALAECAALEERRRTLEQEAVRAREEAARLRTDAKHHAAEARKLQQRIELLHQSQVCPLCQSQLDEAARQRLIADYLRQRDERTAEQRAAEGRAAQLEAQAQELDREVARLNERLRGRAAAEQRRARAQTAAEQAAAAGAELAAATAELAEAERCLASGAYAPAERAQFEQLKAEAEALGYDRAAHQAAAQRAQRLAPYQELREQLKDAQRDFAEATRKLAEGEQALAFRLEDLQAARAEEEALAREAAELGPLQQAAAAAQRQLLALQEQRQKLRDERSQLEGRLAFLDQLARERQDWQAALEQAEREIGIYNELVTAFGKKGVQALLIETAIPELEDLTNELLARMTDNRMHVKFDTQRAKASGDGVIETFDILISDELGVRDYALFSGGEAFRVNFAIRVALSKLLARRAGARLQTLVIDEGFGTQDAEGQTRIIEAIRAIQSDFARILVITHIGELKEAFPDRIEIVKTPRGSIINLN